MRDLRIKNKLDNMFEDDEAEQNLQFAKYHKRYLRFDLGDIVFIKTDEKFKCPMIIKKILIFDEDDDYICLWTTSQLTIDQKFFTDKILTKKQ